ncbi:hypothetical protein [Peterkaempfera sp. SMS 1(5)a]|uniref:hypothetical protein n=1 Tax=Peterkaempfera podocarpi TaxID=3232308 RepID=UPI00367321BB
MRITGLRTVDLRTVDLGFPTSRKLDGSDAMNPDPGYSAASVVITTDDPAIPEGYGFAFTIGRGNDVQVAAIGHCAAMSRVWTPWRSSPTREPSRAPWSTTANCAGRDRRRASSTWRSPPWSTPCGTRTPGTGAHRCGCCSPTWTRSASPT